MRGKIIKLSIKEIAIGILIYVGIVGVMAYFFYRSLWAFIILALVLIVPYVFYYGNFCKRKRKWKETLEFKEMIRLLSSEIQSGASVENAFINIVSEMRKLYGNSVITKECEKIARGISNNEVIEKLLINMATRLDIPEISDFVDVFVIAKRSGGNLKRIIEDSTGAIDARIEMKREFRVLISSKQFEHRIMCLVPFGIVGYIGITSKGYFDILYSTPFGRIIMTVAMIGYLGALIWGEVIINMKI